MCFMGIHVHRSLVGFTGINVSLSLHCKIESKFNGKETKNIVNPTLLTWSTQRVNVHTQVTHHIRDSRGFSYRERPRFAAFENTMQPPGFLCSPKGLTFNQKGLR